MDTKLKNNKKGWMFLVITAALALLASAVMTYQIYPDLKTQKRPETQSFFSTYTFNEYLSEYNEALYYGVHQASDKDVVPGDLFLVNPTSSCTVSFCLDSEYVAQEEAMGAYVQSALTNLGSNKNIVYRATDLSTGKTLTNMSDALWSAGNELVENEWEANYQYFIKLRYDASGKREVVEVRNADADWVNNYMNQVSNRLNWYFSSEEIKPMANFEVIYAVPKEIMQYQSFGNDLYWHNANYASSTVLYVSLLMMLGLAFIGMWIPKKSKEHQIPKAISAIPLEIWVVIAGFVAVMVAGLDSTVGIFMQPQGVANADLLSVLHFVGWSVVFWLSLLAGWVFKMFLFHPVEYLKENTLVMKGMRAIKNGVQSLLKALDQKDTLPKHKSLILKVVAVNAIVLTILTSFWFFGIAGVIAYSLVLYILLNKWVGQVQAHYEGLLRNTTQVARGKFDGMDNQDLGMFQPIQEELATIQVGFKQAVDQEIKSQRMKTELITNVSHDLKTPLTAIVTYTDLLKEEHISEAQKREYVDILERKAKRLQVLIEDLFEMSKATSGTMSLQCSEVDVVSLMKQTIIEMEEDFAAANLQIRESFPQEKVMVTLDPQRTYRIFENLLVNITKYALGNSRVYLDIVPMDEQVQIVFKNVTLEEITFQPDEIVERFVRGDQARNTEGSGLGLAIAKSFTELQKGTMDIIVDGDLFKVVLTFPIDATQP